MHSISWASGSAGAKDKHKDGNQKEEDLNVMFLNFRKKKDRFADNALHGDASPKHGMC